MQFFKPVAGGSTGRYPDFIIIGAAKAGTSSLHLYLGLHPDIFMSKPKETRFFVDAPPPDGYWSLGTDWYQRLFDTDKRWCGEASPQYALTPSTPGVVGRMAAVVPGAKLIYMVREPLARLRSNYLMNVKRCTFTGSFADYVDQYPSAVDASCYGRQLSEYLGHYPLDKILVVETAELHTDRMGALRRIFRFIGARESFYTPLFLHRRNVGRLENVPSPIGRRIVLSKSMQVLERTLHGGIFYHLRNLVIAPFSVPPPVTTLPDAKKRELDTLFRNEVALLRQLTGLPLPSLGSD